MLKRQAESISKQLKIKFRNSHFNVLLNKIKGTSELIKHYFINDICV